MSRSGVLLTAFGGPRTLDEVGPFIATMTGREPSEDALHRARAKYARIGGGSPLPGIAEGIATALERELVDRGRDIRVVLGMRYAEPTIGAAVAALAAEGAETVVALSLSPFEAEITTQAYRDAVAEACDRAGCRVVETPEYFAAPGLVEAHAEALNEALSSVEGTAPVVVMTAHSLPCEETARDDTYVRQLRAAASAVAEASALGEPASTDSVGLWPAAMETLWGQGGPNATPWLVAYQSRGYRACEWLEPELESVIEVAAGEGYDSLVVAPIGFVTDHMETLYDLDIVAREAAASAGLAFARSAALNQDPRLIGVFADAVLSVLPDQEGSR